MLGVWLQATRDNLKVQLDNIAMEVERMDARREAVASLARCEAKLAVSEFEAAVTANDAAKEECVRAEGRLSEARNAIAPLGTRYVSMEGLDSTKQGFLFDSVSVAHF